MILAQADTAKCKRYNEIQQGWHGPWFAGAAAGVLVQHKHWIFEARWAWRGRKTRHSTQRQTHQHQHGHMTSVILCRVDAGKLHCSPFDSNSFSFSYPDICRTTLWLCIYFKQWLSSRTCRSTDTMRVQSGKPFIKILHCWNTECSISLSIQLFIIIIDDLKATGVTISCPWKKCTQLKSLGSTHSRRAAGITQVFHIFSNWLSTVFKNCSSSSLLLLEALSFFASAHWCLHHCGFL